jgi:hypothetical protein
VQFYDAAVVSYKRVLTIIQDKRGFLRTDHALPRFVPEGAQDLPGTQNILPAYQDVQTKTSRSPNSLSARSP